MAENGKKVIHIVQQGENLADLTKYYTGGNNYGEVAQNNGIEDANKIYVGQEIEFTVSSDSKYAEENPGAISDEPVTTEPETSTEPETTSTESEKATQQSSTPAPTNNESNTATYNKPNIFSNKWLCPSCPTANDFYVDKSHTDYYIGYLDSKQSVTALNDSWKSIKSCVEELKRDIETLKGAIDSQDYKKQTNDIIVSTDNAITNLDKNFTALFNSVVNRLIEAAASDEWFSETAIEYATFISETILGHPAPVPQTNNAGVAPENNATETAPSENNAEATQVPESQSTGEQNPQTTSVGRVSNADAASQLGITEEQLDVVKATIRHEAGNNPNEMLVVASVIRNRMNSGVWGGTDAYSVTTAKGQFESYLQGHYAQYTGGNYYQGGSQEDVDAISEQINAILTGSAAPLTDAERFRSGYKEGRVQYNPGGNYYF